MSARFAGGCRCGAVRYESTLDPVMVANCHCRDCQYASGGGFSVVLLAPKAGVQIEGESSAYTVDSDAGTAVTRRFCPVCGSPLFSLLSGMPEIIVVKVGSLDEPGAFAPTMNIWTASAQPWSHIADDLPSFERNPG